MASRSTEEAPVSPSRKDQFQPVAIATVFREFILDYNNLEPYNFRGEENPVLFSGKTPIPAIVSIKMLMGEHPLPHLETSTNGLTTIDDVVRTYKEQDNVPEQLSDRLLKLALEENLAHRVAIARIAKENKNPTPLPPYFYMVEKAAVGISWTKIEKRADTVYSFYIGQKLTAGSQLLDAKTWSRLQEDKRKLRFTEEQGEYKVFVSPRAAQYPEYALPPPKDSSMYRSIPIQIPPDIFVYETELPLSQQEFTDLITTCQKAGVDVPIQHKYPVSSQHHKTYPPLRRESEKPILDSFEPTVPDPSPQPALPEQVSTPQQSRALINRIIAKLRRS